MGISIKNRVLEASIRRLAALNGVDLTKAISIAVERDLLRSERAEQGRLLRMRAIATRVATFEVRDRRSDDEILGYDERGIPS